MSTKEQIITSIVTAEDELKKALSNLKRLPAFDLSYVPLAAHSLKNYLSVITGTVDLLMITLEEHPDPEIHTWLENLQRMTSVMIQTVRRLSNVSIASEMKIVREELDISLGLQRVGTYYQNLADQKHIQIICESEMDSPYVWTDRMAVAVVLDNLMSNAIKYSDPGKRVWVRVTAEPSHFVCSIQDEGPGLSKEDQAKLFQKGVPLGNTPTGGESSTGYGLAIAKELIDKLGGTIWCKSTPGQGACFSFRLPSYVEGQQPNAQQRNLRPHTEKV